MSFHECRSAILNILQLHVGGAPCDKFVPSQRVHIKKVPTACAVLVLVDISVFWHS